MKVYAQLMAMSTGYIEGSIPPVFREDNKKPIDKLGSDGVIILDGRKGIDTLIHEVRDRISKRKDIVGFKLVRAGRFTNSGIRSKFISV